MKPVASSIGMRVMNRNGLWILLTLATPVLAQNPVNRPEAPTPPDVDLSGLQVIRFETKDLALRRNEGRSLLMAGKQVLKDFGPMDREANEAMRIVRDLHYTQYATIPGATPPFEFWLTEDNEGQKSGFAAKNLIGFNLRPLRVEHTVGAWVIRDDNLLIYNFGKDEAATRL